MVIMVNQCGNIYPHERRQKKMHQLWGRIISVPGKVYAKCLKKKCRETVEPKLTDAQSGFSPGRSKGPGLCLVACLEKS